MLSREELERMPIDALITEFRRICGEVYTTKDLVFAAEGPKGERMDRVQYRDLVDGVLRERVARLAQGKK
ncbi:MAG: hypothetical protein AB1515_02095 [Nitrospirota bacterium]